MKWIVFVFCVIVFLNSCKEESYVEYKPHYLSENNEDRFYGESELDSLNFANTVQVFNVYNVDYKIKSANIILISKELSKDWTLLWNLTLKAKDSVWLRSNNPENL